MRYALLWKDLRRLNSSHASECDRDVHMAETVQSQQQWRVHQEYRDYRVKPA